MVGWRSEDGGGSETSGAVLTRTNWIWFRETGGGDEGRVPEAAKVLWLF